MYTRVVLVVRRFGQPMPMYMNIVREPLERMVSHYYYFKNGVKSAVRNPKAQVYNLVSISTHNY